MRRTTVVPFGVGFGVMVTAFNVVYFASIGPFIAIVFQLLTIPFGIALLLLVAEALRTRGRARWLNLLAAAVLLLMFSALAILSIGFLTLPVAAGLLLLSIWKLWGPNGKVDRRGSRRQSPVRTGREAFDLSGSSATGYPAGVPLLAPSLGLWALTGDVDSARGV